MYTNKTILIGDENICKQIAYVFNINNYNIINSIKNIDESGMQYNIIICNKEKSNKKASNIKYLKDLYKELDQQYKTKFEFVKNPIRGIKRTTLKNILVEKLKLTRNNFKNIKRPTFRNIKIINKIPVEFLKPSELLIKVLDSPTKDINCTNIENTCNIDCNGYMWRVPCITSENSFWKYKRSKHKKYI